MLLFVGSCLVAHRVGEVVGSPKGQHRLVGRYLVGKLDTSLVAHRAREVVLVSCWLYKKFCKGLRPHHPLVGRCHSVCGTLCLTSHAILTLYCLSAILVFFALLSLHFFLVFYFVKAVTTFVCDGMLVLSAVSLPFSLVLLRCLCIFLFKSQLLHFIFCSSFPPF